MSTKKKLSDSSVRCYEVSDPTLHPKGHTIYKITQRTIQAEALDANVQEVVVWRRYNDIKRLYKALFHLHHMLHRKEEFPPFSRSKVFGRFDQTVIIDRMRSCQDLLNFVGQRTYLVNSQAFQQFFEGGEKLETDISKCELLKPTTRCQHEGNSWATDSTNSVSLSDASEDDAGVLRGSSAEVTASSSGDQLGDSLGGVWQYRQSADEISLHDDDDDLSFLDDIDSTPAQTDITDIMDDSPCDVVLQKTDIDLFDPLAGRNLSEDDNQCSNEWLLSATPVCDNNKGLPQEMDDDNTNALLQELEKELVSSCGDADRDRSDTSTGVSETGVTPGPSSTDAGYVDLSHGGSKTDISSDTTPKDRSRSSSTVECGKGDLVISPVHPAPSALSFLPSGGPGAKSASPTHSASMQQTKRSEVGSVTCSPRHQGGLVTVDLKQKADYIFQAAHHISLAQQCEASGNYFMAFNYFKSGVGILLTGVQLDENEKRRDIVRKKTAKYLMKAESLHTKYLSGGESTDHWDTRLVSTEKSLQPDVAFLCGPVSELANYRVLGVIDKVQLVMDKVTETTYVIKVLYKSCREPVGQAIVPTICPFMVRLYRYYETSSAIYLLLQHATGGHLWSYVSGYLNQTPQSPQFDDHHGNRQSPNQVGEEITNIKTETSNGDARVPQECAESYKKLFTENSMPSSEIDNGNSNAAPARSQCRKSIDSLGLDKSPDILVLGNTQHPLVRRVSSGKDGTGFGELLKGSDVPVEQFSINSFDSDVTPGGARYNSSTTDYIETVPELSESVSPTMSPSKHATSPADEDVFIERSLDNHLTEIRNGECLRSTPAGGAHDDAIVSPQHRRGQVSMDKIVDGQNTVELDNEPSIYDRPQSTNCDTGSLDESNMYSDSRTEAGENNNHKSDNIECTQSPNTVTESKTSPDTHGTSTDKPEHRQVFRMPSQERSLETRPTGPVRKRSRTGRVRTLSSVFGDLDLADDNGRVESPSLARLPETCVRQWIVEMLVAVTRLHQLGIVCRDLRPANVLLGERGHVILSYFSRWSCVDAETLDVLAVSQLYAAPEVSQLSQEVSDASDWWSVGALMYELLTGRSLASCHPSGINSHTCLMIPDHVSPEAQSLLQQLLKFSPSERLGSGEGGVEDIRAHPFFADVHWPSIS